MASSPEEIRKHIKLYWLVGGVLGICTCFTLALGYFEFFDFGMPGPDPIDIVIGLAVAVFKCSLVILIFMHLNHEKGLIYKTLLFTVAFCCSLMGLTLFAKADPIPPNVDVVDEVVLQAPSLHHDDHGKGHDDHGKGHDDHGKGHDDHGKGHDDHGKGHDDHGKGHDDHGKGHDDDEHAKGKGAKAPH